MTRRLTDYALGLIAFAVSLIVETWQWVRVSRRRCAHAYGVAEQSDGVVCPMCGVFLRWWVR